MSHCLKTKNNSNYSLKLGEEGMFMSSCPFVMAAMDLRLFLEAGEINIQSSEYRYAKALFANQLLDPTFPKLPPSIAVCNHKSTIQFTNKCKSGLLVWLRLLVA